MNKNNNESINICDAIHYVIKSAEENNHPVINSGLKDLDDFTGGWYPGELCVVGGRPAMGKTAFILSVIANIVSSKIPTALFSSTDSINVYFISRIVSCINPENDSHSLKQKLQAIKNSDLKDVPLYLNMQPTLRFAYIKEQCEHLVREKGVKIIFIETIQSMFNCEENGNTKEAMETLCHKIKCLACELNVPIVITSDLNRSPEHREGLDGKIPQIADLRSCSAIENSADSIYLLYRPEYYGISMDETGKDLRGIMNIIIAKKKYNHCGEVEVKFDRNSGRVYNLEKTTLCDIATPVEFNIHTHTDGPF